MTPNCSCSLYQHNFRCDPGIYNAANNINMSNGLLQLGNRIPLDPRSVILAPLSTLPATQSALLLR